jgi:hypothetical protein
MSAKAQSFLRQHLTKIVFIVGCTVAGALIGGGTRWWSGGLNGQKGQLHECVLAAQQAHSNEAAGPMLAHLKTEVPDCMDQAGYAQALDSENCDRALWQGNVYCYAPKSRIGRLLFRVAASL